MLWQLPWPKFAYSIELQGFQSFAVTLQPLIWEFSIYSYSILETIMSLFAKTGYYTSGNKQMHSS